MRWSVIPIALILTACSVQSQKPKSSESMTTIDAKVEALLAKMTLAEKIGQMNQYNGFYNVTGPAPKEGDAAKKFEHLRSGQVGSMLNVRGVEDVRAVQKVAVEETRLGIPLIIGFDVIHGYETLAPIPLAESASWDLAAIERSAQVAAAEAAAAGINWTFAPMVDLSRDARWGRVMEGAGEDPYYASKVAVARVNGFQGNDLSAPNTIAACAKHFAGYGWAEAGKDYNTVDMSGNVLYNNILPPFKAAADAGVKTFMNAFNEMNGIPATADNFLQRDLLKSDWDFDGFVVSDWGSIGEIVIHGHAENNKAAAELAANAGSDMDMESYAYVAYLEELVNEGKVKESVIDEAARRILKVKFELGLFDDPYKYCDEAREKEIIGHKDHHEAVLDMAKKSIVLLKNEGNLLPLSTSDNVVVIGQLANDKNSPLGSWRIAGKDDTAVSVLEGFKNLTGNDVRFEKGVQLTTGATNFVFETPVNETTTTGMSEAVEAARNADKVVMVLGEYGYQSGEGRSRTELDLPGLQQELLEAVHSVNPNVILVLMNGRPLAIDWAAENVPSIVEAWHLGTQSGNAIAEVLFGEYNPSGKLTMTFPRSVGQVPIYYNHKRTGRPNQHPDPNLVFWTHYIDQDNSPLFPFGYGLSYSTFEYSNLTVNVDGPTKVSASVMVKNTSNVVGEEVVQLYIHDRVASITRPIKELKGFEKIMLKAGEQKTVTFELNSEELGFFDNQGNFKVEPGSFGIMIGGSSQEGLTSEFELQ